jgi:hypothetical protein
LIWEEIRFKTTKSHESPVFLTGNCIFTLMVTLRSAGYFQLFLLFSKPT